MAIRVRFDRNGFYHPSFGRLGRGRHEGRIYTLPDVFGEREAVEVDIMDTTRKPPQPSGRTKTIERYKYLPSTAEVISEDYVKTLETDASEGDEDAAEELSAIKSAVAPKRAEDADEYLPGKGKRAKAQNAVERTTGQSARSRSKKAAPVS